MGAIRTFLPQGLVALWALNEANGADRQNSLNPGTLTLTQSGAVTQCPGPSPTLPLGTQLLKATTQYLFGGNFAIPAINNGFAAAIWACELAPVSGQGLLGIASGAGVSPYLLSLQGGMDPTHSCLHFMEQVNGSGSPGLVVPSNLIVPTGTWFHLAWSFDCNSLSLYYNGVLYGTVRVSTPVASSPFAIAVGAAPPGFSNWNGKVCQLALWSRCLLPNEPASIYNNGQGILIP